MHLAIDFEEPESWLLYRVADALRDGKVIALPTDTGYGFACDILNRQATEKLYRLKGMDKQKLLSILVPDIQTASLYTAGIPNTAFRIMRRALPGPYTFILRASKEIPRTLLTKQRTIGIRIPDAPLIIALGEQFERAILISSVPADDDQASHDPQQIEREYRELDLIVDSGILPLQPSTILDLTGNEPVVLREGAGSLDVL